MGNQTPSVGRMVHFVYGDQHLPAIITDPNYPGLHEEGQPEWYGQALTVFPVGAAPFTTVATAATPDDPNVPGTWHWPEYVPAK